MQNLQNTIDLKKNMYIYVLMKYIPLPSLK